MVKKANTLKHVAKKILKKDPQATNVTILKALNKKTGRKSKHVDGAAIAVVRKSLGIITWQSRRDKPAPGKYKKNNDAVFVSSGKAVAILATVKAGALQNAVRKDPFSAMKSFINALDEAFPQAALQCVSIDNNNIEIRRAINA